MSQNKPTDEMLFNLLVDYHLRKAEELCLEKARRSGESVLRGLSNAQLSVLAELAVHAPSQDKLLEGVRERQRRRWDKQAEVPQVLNVINQDFASLKPEVNKAIQNARESFNKIFGREYQGKSDNAESLLYQMSRRYVLAAVKFSQQKGR